MGAVPSEPGQTSLLSSVQHLSFEGDGQEIVERHRVHLPYEGIWSIRLPAGRGPSPRTGNFMCYSQEYRTAFVGYGQKKSGKLLNDVWALDLDDMTWTKLKLSEEIHPRTGSVAQMMGKYIVVFGGYSGNTFYSDLHTIDITTGEILFTITKNEPRGVAEPIMAIYENKLFVYGGFNGNLSSFLNIMDFTTMCWKSIDTGFESRAGTAWAIFGNKIAIYGNSHDKNFSIVDLNLKTVQLQNTSGSAPPSEITDAKMVKASDYFLFFGGKSKTNWTFVYGCDFSQSWWFVFFVGPDGETVTENEGRISSDGLFLLPHIESFSVLYEDRRREIFAFLGHPHKCPVPVYSISIGNALSVLHLRDDMRNMLS